MPRNSDNELLKRRIADIKDGKEIFDENDPVTIVTVGEGQQETPDIFEQQPEPQQTLTARFAHMAANFGHDIVKALIPRNE